jgi:hypothetical protein
LTNKKNGISGSTQDVLTGWFRIPVNLRMHTLFRQVSRIHKLPDEDGFLDTEY